MASLCGAFQMKDVAEFNKVLFYRRAETLSDNILSISCHCSLVIYRESVEMNSRTECLLLAPEYSQPCNTP
jgi:hypothetical protein